MVKFSPDSKEIKSMNFVKPMRYSKLMQSWDNNEKLEFSNIRAYELLPNLLNELTLYANNMHSEKLKNSIASWEKQFQSSNNKDNRYIELFNNMIKDESILSNQHLSLLEIIYIYCQRIIPWDNDLAQSKHNIKKIIDELSSIHTIAIK